MGHDSDIEIIEGGVEGGNDELEITERDAPQTQGGVELRDEVERSEHGGIAALLAAKWQPGQVDRLMAELEGNRAASETGLVVQCGEYLNPWLDD